MTLADVQDMAYNVMSMAQPKLSKPVRDSAIYKFWLEHKDAGTPMTKEMALEDGTTAVVTSTGKVLHWLGGDDVEVL